MRTIIIIMLSIILLLSLFLLYKSKDSASKDRDTIDSLIVINDSLAARNAQLDTLILLQSSTITILNNEIAKLHNRPIASYIAMPADSVLSIFTARASYYIERGRYTSSSTD